MSDIKTNAPNRRQKILAFIALCLLLAFSLVGPSLAQSVTRGYKSDEVLQRGMLVALSKQESEKVEPLTRATLDHARGVVVQQNDSPVTLSSEDSKIFVADNGSYEVLVIDQNGNIKEGDYISISGLEGVGMRADRTQKTVIGRALADFNGSQDAIGSTTIGESEVLYNIGRLPVSIAIGENPNYIDTDKSNIPEFLQNAGDTIAEQSVNPVRIYLSLILFIATVGVVGFMLYGGAKNSMVAIGRNPLSKKVVLRGLMQVSIVSLIIFAVGMLGVYLLLKL